MKGIKSIKPYLFFIIGFPLFFIFPKICLFYWICGLIDIRRHGPFQKALLKQYFTKNGITTWLFSPLNLLCDCLAWSMKPIYQLNELPEDTQNEINEVIEAARTNCILDVINQQLKNAPRSMLFFKWYGKTMKEASLVPCYQKQFKHIRTIGLSVFNKNKSTSAHFGPTRYTLRVLYNLTPIQHDGVYIQVNQHQHFWHDNPMFIFDDTFLHQSFNESEERRYCLFIDIVRPSIFAHPFFSGLIYVTRALLLKFNFIFYQKWVFLNDAK